MAVYWFRKAADQNHAEAQFKLGLCYLMGDGVMASTDSAKEWCQKAQNNGCRHAEAIVGFKSIKKWFAEKNRIMQTWEPLIEKWCLELAKAGYKPECNQQVNTDRLLIIGVNDENGKSIGDIWFTTTSLYDCGENIRFLKQYNAYIKKESDAYHTILLDKMGIKITSKVPLSKEPEPPRWMRICARVLQEDYDGEDIRNPEWVNGYAMTEYVNAAFLYTRHEAP